MAGSGNLKLKEWQGQATAYKCESTLLFGKWLIIVGLFFPNTDVIRHLLLRDFSQLSYQQNMLHITEVLFD